MINIGPLFFGAQDLIFLLGLARKASSTFYHFFRRSWVPKSNGSFFMFEMRYENGK